MDNFQRKCALNVAICYETGTEEKQELLFEVEGK
jgi:hypothetical protein